MHCLIAKRRAGAVRLEGEIYEKLATGSSTSLRLDGVGRRYRAQAGRPADQARIVRQALRHHRTAGRRRGRHAAANGEPGELYIRTTLAMDGYHRTDQQLHEVDVEAVLAVGRHIARIDDEATSTSATGHRHDHQRGMNIYPAEIERYCTPTPT